jgi:hypothetical protein
VIRRATDQARPILVLFFLVMIGAGSALLLSSRTTQLGFPLDDAWIHQTYARNLAFRGEWAFLPGQPSAGSTAPLWTLMLTLGYLLRVDHRIWSYLLGSIFLVLTGWFATRWMNIRTERLRQKVALIGVVVVLEWHLVWAALSGMEIPVLTFLIVAALLWMETEEWNPFVMGALLGLGVWVRPDALSLWLPLVWHVIFQEAGQPIPVMRKIGRVGIGFAGAMAPYLILNYSLSDTFWPSTFYAKQAEYAIMRELPILNRLISQLSLPLIGVGTVLIPGLIFGTLRIVRDRTWRRLAPLIWALALLGVYAIRLPVTYQYGRYVMPVLPVVLVLGMEGLQLWVRPKAEQMLRRVLSKAWPLTVLVVNVVFLGFAGIPAHARDVAIIETEMVAAARWIALETEKNALIAAHDIGALGYFGERDLIDLAGLVSPEVIPFIRDEEALGAYIDKERADYLMTFPGWYPELVKDQEPIFSTNAVYSPEAGGENMMVFRWVSGRFAP